MSVNPAADGAAFDTGIICSTFVEDAPFHLTLFVEGPLPEPLGGAIEDGLYYRTESRCFNCGVKTRPSEQPERRALLISGRTFDEVGESGPPAGKWRYTLEKITEGFSNESFGLKLVCPQPPPSDAATAADYITYSYSFVGSGPGAALTRMSKIPTTPGATWVETFTRQ